MRHSDEKDRVFVFSLNYGLTTFAGVFGSLLAGNLPSTFEGLSHVSAMSAVAYEAVLIVCGVLGGFSLIPVLLINDEKPITLQQAHPSHLKEMIRQTMVGNLAISNLLIGLGTTFLMPYRKVFLTSSFWIPRLWVICSACLIS
jgi:hypothetical protein